MNYLRKKLKTVNEFNRSLQDILPTSRRAGRVISVEKQESGIHNTKLIVELDNGERRVHFYNRIDLANILNNVELTSNKIEEIVPQLNLLGYDFEVSDFILVDGAITAHPDSLGYFSGELVVTVPTINLYDGVRHYQNFRFDFGENIWVIRVDDNEFDFKMHLTVNDVTFTAITTTYHGDMIKTNAEFCDALNELVEQENLPVSFSYHEVLSYVHSYRGMILSPSVKVSNNSSAPVTVKLSVEHADDPSYSATIIPFTALTAYTDEPLEDPTKYPMIYNITGPDLMNVTWLSALDQDRYTLAEPDVKYTLWLNGTRIEETDDSTWANAYIFENEYKSYLLDKLVKLMMGAGLLLTGSFPYSGTPQLFINAPQFNSFYNQTGDILEIRLVDENDNVVYEMTLGTNEEPYHEIEKWEDFYLTLDPTVIPKTHIIPEDYEGDTLIEYILINDTIYTNGEYYNLFEAIEALGLDFLTIEYRNGKPYSITNTGDGPVAITGVNPASGFVVINYVDGINLQLGVMETS